jgi:hypothetical protein
VFRTIRDGDLRQNPEIGIQHECDQTTRIRNTVFGRNSSIEIPEDVHAGNPLAEAGISPVIRIFRDDKEVPVWVGKNRLVGRPHIESGSSGIRRRRSDEGKDDVSTRDSPEIEIWIQVALGRKPRRMVTHRQGRGSGLGWLHHIASTSLFIESMLQRLQKAID